MNQAATEIETERLLLRLFCEADLDDYAARIFADPQVTRYLPPRLIPAQERARRALTYITNHWERNGYGIWAVTDKADVQFIGQCGLNYLQETGEVEVDYALAKAYWGKGIASEAAREAVRFAFEVLELERIIGLVVPENTASRRVLEKLGFTYVKETHLFDLDLVCYELLRAAHG
jgi:ribosomal-protein-alanine N-acetyltransferase